MAKKDSGVNDAPVEVPDVFYARLSPDAVVLEVFKNPAPEVLASFEKAGPRLRQCPPETRVGWFRKDGEFYPPAQPEEAESDA